MSRIADRDAEGLVPAICHRREPGIERGTKLLDDVGERIREVFVLAPPKAVATHHHAASEVAVVRIEGSQRAALLRFEEMLEDGATARLAQ